MRSFACQVIPSIHQNHGSPYAAAIYVCKKGLALVVLDECYVLDTAPIWLKQRLRERQESNSDVGKLADLREDDAGGHQPLLEQGRWQKINTAEMCTKKRYEAIPPAETL
jgi:hypothetical protein